MFDVRFDAEQRAARQAYIDSLVERVASEAGVPISGQVLDGAVVDALLEHAAHIAADLVVMTTHGRGGLSRAWLGSVTDQLVRRGSIPVLLVRPTEAEPEVGAPVTFEEVLLPLDGSERDEEIMGQAARLGSLMNAEHILLRVITPLRVIHRPAPVTSVDTKDLARKQADAEAHLERVAERLRRHGLAVRTRVVANERTAHAILEVAREEGVDLIAMATRGHGPIQRAMLGSVADKVLRGASTAVLLYHPRMERELGA